MKKDCDLRTIRKTEINAVDILLRKATYSIEVIFIILMTHLKVLYSMKKSCSLYKNLKFTGNQSYFKSYE